MLRIRYNKDVEELKKQIVPILRKYKIKKAGIFGSYARGDYKKNSDIDVLIEFNGSLLTLVRIERELKDILGTKVDLLTYKGLSPLLKRRILKEEIRVL